MQNSKLAPKKFSRFNVLVVYMARDVMIFMGGKSISRAIGRGKGVALKIETFLVPEMATSEASVVWAQKSRDF